MFNLDSLAWQWHIPALARDIFPWVSWLFRGYVALLLTFLVIGVSVGLLSVWTGRMRYVGLSRKERREYADRYRRDNNRAAPFSVLASLDSPGRAVTARRHLHFGEPVPVNALADFSTEQARQQQVVFLGKDEDGQPVRVPREAWRKTNIQILGLPGSGKSVMATNALIRCVRDFGDAVVYFDPKGDAWAPHVFRAHCPDFTLLDLRPGKPAQLNLFRDLDQYALKNLLVAGFNLAETGDVADHYRISEQKAAKLIADQFPHGANIQQVLAAAYALPEALKKDVKGLITKLENVTDLSVLQTDSGIDVAGIINGGGCLYVIGSMDDEAVIRVQKMLFARCAQIIIARDEFREWPHVSVMLDEIKYLLSKYVLNALGTLRSRDCNLLLAHQSLGDFGQCGQDLPADFVKTTVLDNTPIRWFYRAASQESAQWAAGQTGEIRVDVERRRASREAGNVEHISGDSFIQKEARPLFDVNTLQHLPDGFAVMTGLGVARLAFSSPLRVERREIPLKTFPVLAKTDPLGEYQSEAVRQRPGDDDFAGLY